MSQTRRENGLPQPLFHLSRATNSDNPVSLVNPLRRWSGVHAKKSAVYSQPGTSQTVSRPSTLTVDTPPASNCDSNATAPASYVHEPVLPPDQKSTSKRIISWCQKHLRALHDLRSKERADIDPVHIPEIHHIPSSRLHSDFATLRRGSAPRSVPQEKVPVSGVMEIRGNEIADLTVKRIPSVTSETTTEPIVPIPSMYTTLPSSSVGSHDEDVQDLTGLVQRGSIIYKGQYSDVYQGLYSQHLVAIKVIKSLPYDPLHAVRRRMRREVGAASHFNHANVLSVYGVIEEEWCQLGGIVTPWCENSDSSNYLRCQRVPPLARLFMVRGVVAGLEYIHGLSVVHGDLKPGNILVDALGNPLICDFGLVSILDAEQPDRTADNTTTIHNGTVRYLAYELVKDPPESRTMASDIHALGCVAYEFLYLERPYAARTGNNAELYIFRDIAAGILPAYPPSSSPPVPHMIAALWGLLGSCWEREPSRRPGISSFARSFQSLEESDLHVHLRTH